MTVPETYVHAVVRTLVLLEHVGLAGMHCREEYKANFFIIIVTIRLLYSKRVHNTHHCLNTLTYWHAVRPNTRASMRQYHG